MFLCKGPGPTDGTQNYLFAGCPNSRCNSLRSGFGITTRSALSMVRRTPIVAWYNLWTQQSMPFVTFAIWLKEAKTLKWG